MLFGYMNKAGSEKSEGRLFWCGKSKVKIHQLKRQKTFVMQRFLLSVLTLMVGVVTLSGELLADNVAMVETMKYLAPSTVEMVKKRGYGIQPGDSITYIIKYKPVNNGGNTGANGYITDYIPEGLQVVGASFVEPVKDINGNIIDYRSVYPNFAGDMANDPALSGRRFGVSLTPLLPATPINTGNIGTLAQWYGDVGIWYSTNPLTAMLLVAPVGSSRNQWDTNEMAACPGGGLTYVWGTCSPVSGPETFYQNQAQLPAGLGPWNRIATPGSRIGDYGLMGDLQASRELLPGDPLYGRDLATNPLPAWNKADPLSNQVTIRWANGLNSVPNVMYVSVTANVVTLPAGGGIINESEVWGGDVYYHEGGKDNAWKYNNTLVSIGNNTDLTVLKNPSKNIAAPGDAVSFQITVINTGAATQTGLTITDYLNTSHRVGRTALAAPMVTYNLDASGGGIYTAGPTGNLAGAENITWTVPSLTSGQAITFSYSVTALLPPDPQVTAASDEVVVTSLQMPAPGVVANASFDIGDFPALVQSKTVSPSVVLPGGIVRYHIQMTNTGSGMAGTWTDPATGIISYPVSAIDNITPVPTTITDTLPTGFTYAGNAVLTLDGALVLGATVTALGNQVEWLIPHEAVIGRGPNQFSAGSILDIYFDAQVNAGLAPGTYTNSVMTTVPYNNAGGGAPRRGRDWGQIPLSTQAAAPVTVGTVLLSKTANPSTVVVGNDPSKASYTITVSNNGATAATGVVVTDVLPTGFSYDAATAPTVVLNGVSLTPAAYSVTTTVQGLTFDTVPAGGFTINSGSNLTITFSANIAATVAPGLYYNNVSATGGNVTIPPLSNAAPVTVTTPGVSLTKSVDRNSLVWMGDGYTVAPFPSEVVYYTITATNSGSGFATLDISDQLPAGFVYDPLLGVEVVEKTVAGVKQAIVRGVANTATTYLTFPALLTRTPSWGTFIIDPRQGLQDSTLTIRFPARAEMAATPPLGVTTVTKPGVYDNQVTAAGTGLVPGFIGAPVEIYRPATKWTTTPNVIISGMVDYYVQIENRDQYSWSGVSVTDYLGSLGTNLLVPLATPSGATFGVANTAFYAISASQPAAGSPAWLPIVPTAGVNTITFAPLGAVIPAGQSLWLAFNVTAPAPVAAGKIDNSIQTLSFLSAAPGAVARSVSNVWDGGLPANSAEDVSVTTTPQVTLNASKTVAPGSLHLNGAAAANAVTYTITLTNPDVINAANGVLITDTLAPGFSFGVGDTASVSINGATAVPLVATWTAPLVPGGSGTLAIPLGLANPIPAAGTAVITFTASVALATPGNSYFNSFTVSSDIAVATANVLSVGVGPTAPVIIDPVQVAKQALTVNASSGGQAKYRMSVSNTAPAAATATLTALSVTDTLPAGFTFASDAQVSLGGVPLVAGVDYTAPLPGAVAPVWTLLQAVPGATGGVPTELVVDFYANIGAAVIAGTYHNTIGSMSYTVNATPVVLTLPFDGALLQNTTDDVTVSSVGISKVVVNPYATVVNDPVLGTITKYLITVSNTSAAPVVVNVQDTLPNGFTYLLGSTLINGVAVATNPVGTPQVPIWTALNAAIGNTTLQFTATIAPSVNPDTYNNRVAALVAGVQSASYIGAPVAVVAPQLSISKNTTTPNIGRDIYGNFSAAHYRLTLTNTGNADASGIVVSDTLPANFTLVPGSVSALVNGVGLPLASYSAVQLAQIITFDTLPAGGFTVPAASGGSNGQLLIEYDVAIASIAVAGIQTNTASATSVNAGAKGPVTATVTLHDVGLSKVASTSTAVPGDSITYTITASNFGALAITNVIVNDFLPLGFSYIPGTSLINGVLAADPLGALSWTIPTLAAASSATVVFQAQISPTAAAGTYMNSVTASGNLGAVVFPNTGNTAPVTINSYTIGDRVFIDTNGNTLYDTGVDTPVSGITVELQPSGGGAAIQTTTTDATGYYVFTPALPNTYLVVVTDTLNLLNGYPSVTGGNTQSSTVSSLAPQDLARDFGYVLPPNPATIQGSVFIDTYATGTFDAADSGLAGVLVSLKNSAGVVIDTYTSTAAGFYEFTGFAAGSYTVLVTSPPTGFDVTTVHPIAVTAVNGVINNAAANNIGYGPYGSISGTIFSDANGDGTLTAEVGIAGVIVDRYTNADVFIDSYTTNASGLYLFESIPNGTYKIYGRSPAGFAATTVQPLSVTASVGSQNSGNNLGYQQYSKISGIVFADVNNNMTFDAGDSLLSGVTVNLKNGATVVDTYTSTVSGSYEFNVLLGTAASINYTVDVDQTLAPISGAALTTANDPQTVVVVTAGTTYSMTDIGYLVQGSISGTVYEDKNGTLLFDLTPLPADTALTAATVNLYDADGVTLHGTTTSAMDGSFSFTGLIGADYYVEVVTPATYSAVSPAVVLPATQPRRAITLASGTAVIGQNFGFTLPPNLSVTKTTPSPFAARTSSVNYSIQISNSGGTATYVQVTDWLPNLTHVGWLGLTLPTASPAAFVYPAANVPQATSIYKNGILVATLPLAPYTELAGVGTITWSLAAPGGFTLNTGDVLQIDFTADTPNTEASYFNSLQVDYYAGATAQPTLWYPDINVVSVTRTYTMDKTVIAVNGVVWGGGTPTIDVGDIVTYQVMIANQIGRGRVNREEISVATLTDTLPLGFKYVLGTSKTVSPGNTQPLLTPVLDPLVTPATALTSEILTYTFNGSVIPNRNRLPIVGDSMVTGPSTGDTATLQFDAYAEDILTPNTPVAGLHDNRVATLADQLRGRGITQTFIGATVNVSANAHLQGTIFHELTVDGVYNSATLDMPLNGITVALQPSGGGAAIDTYTTGANGLFDLVAPGAGSYQVVVTDVAGILAGFTNPVVPLMPVTILDSQKLTGLNFGYALAGAAATVNGTVFGDANLDGILNGVDAGIPGAQVNLTTISGTVVASSTTTAAGLFSFNNLAAGNYKIDVVNSGAALYPLNGQYNTPAASPVDPYTITVVAGSLTSKDFGWAPGATFSGTVFDDYSTPGVFSPGEPGHANVTMNLIDTATGSVIRTTTTAYSPVSPAIVPALGSYQFDAVAPGTYRIDVTDTFGELLGYTLTTVNQPMVPLAVAGGLAYVNDFGYLKAPNISVFKTMASSTLDRGTKMDVTLTVTNAGGGVSAFSVADVMPVRGGVPVSPFVGGLGMFSASAVAFVYDSPISITLDGVALTAGVDYTAPILLSATPTWTLTNGLPGNSTLVIHFNGAQPGGAGRTGSPNYNGAAIQYGTPATVVDFPNLITFSVARDLTFDKRVKAINAIPYVGTGRPVIHPGDTVTFELAVANTLRGRQIDVTSFSDTLPADMYGYGLTYVPGSSVLTNPLLGGIPTIALDPVITPYATPGVSPYVSALAPGASQGLTWSYVVPLPGTTTSYPSEVVMQFDAYASPSYLPGLYLNQGSAMAGRTGRAATQVNASKDFDVTYDLTITKTVNKATISPGGYVTYTVNITNNSATGAVAGLTLVDQLSNGFSYTTGTSKFNGAATADPAGTTTQMQWSLPSIAGGATLTVTFSAQAAAWAPVATHTNTATLMDIRGVTVATTGATAPVDVSASMASLTVLKQANVATAKPGSVIIYTVTTQNSGAGVATNVIVNDNKSTYTSLATDPWGNGTPVKFTDGANPSALTTGAITYSNDGGVTYGYPLNMALTYDPYVTNFKVQMNGTMNANPTANPAANPSFILQYKVRVN